MSSAVITRDPTLAWRAAALPCLAGGSLALPLTTRSHWRRRPRKKEKTRARSLRPPPGAGGTGWGDDWRVCPCRLFSFHLEEEVAGGPCRLYFFHQ
jgi:hypothetical protein